MTREEAIKGLKVLRKDFSGYKPNEEMFDMAIEALKGEQPDEWCTDCKEYDTEKKCCPRFNRVIRGALKREPSDDLISRRAVIDALYDKGSSMTAWGELLAMKWSDIQKCIEQLPSADRPKGKWANKEGIHGVAYCSECDYELHSNNTNFCPNCGADMRGEDE